MNRNRFEIQHQPNAEIWLTLRHAAARAAVSEATIKREVSRGRIRCARVGGRRSLRFRAEWVDAWLERTAKPVETSTGAV
jgi:excisionase family DNA binding protein